MPVVSRVRLEQEVHGWVTWVHHSLGCQPDRCPGSPEYSTRGSDCPGRDINPTQQRICIRYLRYVYGVEYGILRGLVGSNFGRNKSPDSGEQLLTSTSVHTDIHLVIPSILDRSDTR